jgi:hypothetical protein
MEGIYVMYFTGSAGAGQGLLILKNGVIVGADVAGVVYDGSYTQEVGGTLDVKVHLTLPPGSSLVTGASAGATPMEIDIPVKLPENFGNGQALALKTPTGPINIIFKRLRDVP